MKKILFAAPFFSLSLLCSQGLKAQEHDHTVPMHDPQGVKPEELKKKLAMVKNHIESKLENKKISEHDMGKQSHMINPENDMGVNWKPHTENTHH